MGIEVIGVLLVVVAVLVLAYFYIKYNTKDTEIPKDAILFEHYILPGKYTQGYSEGFIIKKVKGAERTMVLFRPKDIDYVEVHNSNKIEEVEDQIIYVRNDLLIPKNNSERRRKLVGLPHRIESIPEEEKQTEWGKKMVEMITEKNTTWNEREVLQEAIKRKNELALMNAGGEQTAENIASLTAIMNDSLKVIAGAKGDKTNPLLPNHQGGQ